MLGLRDTEPVTKSKTTKSLLSIRCRLAVPSSKLSRPAVGPKRTFLGFPPEMRLAVYEAVLLHDYDHRSHYEPEDNNDPALLQARKQINMEAQETLAQRPKVFDSQAKLFAWIERNRPSNLSRVRTITLRLRDIDLSSLLFSQPPQQHPNTTTHRYRTRSTTSPSAWSLYQAELRRLEEALSALPNLATLTLVPHRSDHKLLVKGMYEPFLAALPRRCPKLRLLELHDRESLLEEVTALKEIPKVVFKDSGQAGRQSEQNAERVGSSGAESSRGTEEAPRRRTRHFESEDSKPQPHSAWARTVLQ